MADRKRIEQLLVDTDVLVDHLRGARRFEPAATVHVSVITRAGLFESRKASPMGATEDDRLDRDLVEQAQRGDREAFAILARTHGDRLMAIAHRILRGVGRAEDAVQQTLAIAWRELPSLRDPDRFDTYNAQFIDLKAPANQIVLFHLAGALNEHPEDDGAMGNREAAFACVIQSMWGPDSGAGDAKREWVRSAWQALKPYSTGGNYVNFQTDDEADERTVESYRNNYERLGSVKATYDPSNLFRVNRNIRP